MARTANPPRVHCNVEWHLRSHPRANSVYGLALHVTKGKGPFYLSVHQVGDFFGWDVKTVRAAFRTLRDCGFFTLIRRGSGGIGQVSLANVYSVTTHSKLPKDKYPCRPLPEIGSLVSLADAQGRGKTGSTPLPETGSLRPLPETGSLVSDSPSKSSSAANAPGKKRSAPPEF